MKFLECIQGSEEWLQARSGLITASLFSEICIEVGGLDEKQKVYVDALLSGVGQKEAMIKAGYAAPPKSKTVARALEGEITTDYSDGAKRYASDLAIERISGHMYGIPPKAWVLNRGHEMEVHARRLYEGRTGAFVTEAGICVDENRFGYSTDGLVDNDGLIEIKSPIDSIKIEQMLITGDVSEYIHQMQGGMWLTNRKWCDFIMYVPDLESVEIELYVKRILRDDAFIDEMVVKLGRFSNLVAQKEAFFRSVKNTEAFNYLKEAA
ncbi:lambda exonuclease family protein [Solimicrobium silvestre]|uniref:YqaJ-like viral recombinase domain n=1 Tax=Solimicrobium silvestre TaxID=2099400 RepID=A0A2S9GY42_9BURK|nr:lambda exonuclease family protein [Solimicrobium silvestre]PRC92631.1 YqaJ-like viral recombinase domain [Solimicrobium silvestre]